MARHESVLVSRSIYQIGLVTLVAAIMWVAIGIYLTITKTVAVEVEKTLMEPLVTKLDMEVVDQLATRLKVEVLPIPITKEVVVGTESASLQSEVDDTIEAGSENELTN